MRFLFDASEVIALRWMLIGDKTYRCFNLSAFLCIKEELAFFGILERVPEVDIGAVGAFELTSSNTNVSVIVRLLRGDRILP